MKYMVQYKRSVRKQLLQHCCQLPYYCMGYTWQQWKFRHISITRRNLSGQNIYVCSCGSSRELFHGNFLDNVLLPSLYIILLFMDIRIHNSNAMRWRLRVLYWSCILINVVITYLLFLTYLNDRGSVTKIVHRIIKWILIIETFNNLFNCVIKEYCLIQYNKKPTA